MGQRAVLADDVHRLVRGGEVDAHVLRHSGEGGKQTQQLGVGGLFGEVEREALRGAGRYTIISHTHLRSSRHSTNCTRDSASGLLRIIHWRKPSKSAWPPLLSRNCRLYLRVRRNAGNYTPTVFWFS